MPKFEVTLNGVRTQMYTCVILVDAEDEDEAWEKGEDFTPKQTDWVEVEYDDSSDREIEPDGVDEVEEITVTMNAQTSRTSYKYVKE